MLLRLRLEDTFDDHKVIGSLKMVEGEALRVGRRADMDLVLPDGSRFTSGYHCEIRHGPDGFKVLDYSANGTLVNGRSMSEGRHILVDGDRLAIGRYVIVVAIEPIGRRSDPTVMMNCGQKEAVWLTESAIAKPLSQSASNHVSAPAEAAVRRRGGDPAEMVGDVARRLAELDSPTNASKDWTQISMANEASPFNTSTPQSYCSATGVTKPISKHVGKDEILAEVAKALGLNPDELAACDLSELVHQLATLVALTAQELHALLAVRRATRPSGTGTAPRKINTVAALSGPDALRVLFASPQAAYLDANRAFRESFKELRDAQS